VEADRFYRGLFSPTHHFVYGDIGPSYFVFNDPESACRTCGGLGVDKLTHPELPVPDPQRSIANGCFVREAFRYNPDHVGRAHDVQLRERPWMFIGHAMGKAAGSGAQRHPIWDRPKEDHNRPAPPTLKTSVTIGSASRWASVESPAHRAALPVVPAKGRSGFENGGLAR
jgi:hypothetical protein